MYLHLGQETTVKKREVIGIFDIDKCSVSPVTRQYFKKSEEKKRVVNISDELPKSFIVTGTKDKKMYISQLSPITLKKRWEEADIY
jgi:hypothetical protein